MCLLYVFHEVLRYVIVLMILQWIAMCIMCVAMYMGIVSRKVIAWHICYWTYVCMCEIDVSLESMVSVGILMGILLGHVS